MQPNLLASLFLAALFLPLVLATGYYLAFAAGSKVAPGAKVRWLPVGDLTLEGAAGLIDQTWNHGFWIVAVDASDPSRVWAAQPGEFGMSVNAEETARRVFALGREGGIAKALTDLLRARFEGPSTDPALGFDAEAARAGLQAWASRLEVAPVEGAITIQEGVVVQAAGSPGKTLDIDATTALLAANVSAVYDYDIVPLVMRPVPPRVYDVASATAEVQRLVNSGLTLRAYDPVTDQWKTWAPAPSEILTWLRASPQGEGVQVAVDDDALDGYLKSISSELGAERELPQAQAHAAALSGLRGGSAGWIQIHYRPRHIAAPGGATLTSLAATWGFPGWKVVEYDPQLASRPPYAGEGLVMPPRDAMLPLPVVPSKRIVINISGQRMYVYQNGSLVRSELVSTGIPDSPTLPGLFQVKSHYPNAYASRWDLWMPNFLGIYDALPGFENGIHGLPMLSSGQRLWADVLGRPASFGCVILTLDAAEWLYNWADNGVVVVIQP